MTDRRIAGRFVLRERLGVGGMGVVWRAIDEVLGREVAVKHVQTHYAGRGRLIREAQAAGRLNHDGVVTVYDVVSHGDEIFIVMEFVAAPTLAALVERDGPLPADRVARIGLGLLEVLQEVHRIGIVHRDVKPANVMVLAGDRVKLADFGVAHISGDPASTGEGAVLGSPAYMAPEQVRGLRSDEATDAWGLGATLYYAAEGVAAFDRETDQACLAAVLTDPPPSPRKADADLAGLLTALLEKDPARRPGPDHIRERLEHIAAPAVPVIPPPRKNTTKDRPEPWTDPHPPAGERGRSDPSRRTLTVAVAAVAAVVLLAVPTWLALRPSAPSPGADPHASPSTGLIPTGLIRHLAASRPSPSVGPIRQTTTHTVTYKVSGTANSALITYTTPSGSEQNGDARVPWQKSFKAHKDTFDGYLSLSAQNSGHGGTITCEIYVDGVKVKAAKSIGEGTIASCRGSLEF